MGEGSGPTGSAGRERPPAVFLMGPTAAGKTAMAVALHERFPVDIISVDSAQVYRGMDIGTAKPDAATLRRAPHALIDIRDPAQPYSAAEFREDALAAMARSAGQGRVPLLAGGTMLYFRALSRGLAELPSASVEVRAELEAEARARGWAALHRRLENLDPASADRIHPNDPQRIQRALEVIRLTGRSLSELQRADAGRRLPYRVLRVVANPRPRAVLHERIERRFLAMLEQGFLDEVRALRERGDLTPDLPAMRSVGYRQAWSYLEGEIDYATLCRKGVVATRQLAKRQLTWLRQETDALCYDPGKKSEQETVFGEMRKFLEL